MLNISFARILLIAVGAAVLLVFAAVFFADDTVAQFVSTQPWSGSLHSPALGSPVLVALSFTTVLVGAVLAANGRPLPRLMQILVIASFSLVWSVCVNEYLLKYIFGRGTPDDFLRTGSDTFRWFQGAPTTSFPSGHAVQIMSVGTVFLMAYPRQWPAWVAVIGLGLIPLVLGNWHFMSDVIAGAAFGVIGGAATFRLWRSKFE